MYPVSPPFAFFVDRDGNPLQGGVVYFGEVNQNPETNPITVTWDLAGLIPAAQPIKTMNGYPIRNGSPAQIYVAGDHSITVRDSKNRIVITSLKATDAFGAGAVQSVNIADGAIQSQHIDPDGIELPDGSTAATQSGSDSSAWIATTAQVQAAVTTALNAFLQNKVYPIGCLYTSFTTTDNPSVALGFGTWAAVAGRVVVGYDNSQTEFDTLLETGGEKAHANTAAENGPHTHPLKDLVGGNGGVGGGGSFYPRADTGSDTYATGSSGTGDPHNNLQPYIVGAVWRRTA